MRNPTVKGSIEVHAMLKHAMGTSNVKVGIGWEITILWKGVCMRFSFYTPNFEHLEYSVERLATADVPGCDYSYSLMRTVAFILEKRVFVVGYMHYGSVHHVGVGFGVAYLTE